MKSFLLSLVVLCSFISSALASHYAGADIRYEHTGTGNLYKVTLTIYKRCEPNSIDLSGIETVTFKSVSNNVNTNRPFNKQSQDTLGLFCSGFQVLSSCYQAGSPWPGIVVGVYADTFTIVPGSDWYISWTNGTRSGSTLNLFGASGINIYVEAFLNNSTSINSSAWMVNKPPLVIAANNLNTSPFNTVDYDGDSVAYEFYTPLVSATTAATYSAGYTLASPLGSGGVAQISGNNLQLNSSLGGVFALGIIVKEYRNGQLIGYSRRDWSLASMASAPINIPVVQPGSVLQVVTCPGQSHTISLTFGTGVSTEPVTVERLPVNNGITFTGGFGLGMGFSTVNISWTTPATLNPATTPHFYIPVMVSAGTCGNPNPVLGVTYYAVEVHTAQCSTDSVWAGDANGDNTVNVYDPLAIAIANGTTGFPRSAVSTAWAAQYCTDWTTSFTNLVNMKHADCNGDGTVNNTDLAAVTTNWALTHPKEGYSSPIAKVTGNPDLYFDLTGITLSPGATVSIPVKLGSATSVMSNFYGVATHVKIDGLNFGSAPAITNPISWIGTAANTLSFTKNVSNNNVAWAYARNDHQNVSGSGTIANVQFTVPANAIIGQQVVFSFQNAKFIDRSGAEITAVNIVPDTAIVNFPLAVGTTQGLGFNMQVIPNPSANHALLSINTAASGTITIRITDIAGRVVLAEKKHLSAGTSEIKLPAQMISSGMYVIDAELSTSEQQRLKWIKQ